MRGTRSALIALPNCTCRHYKGDQWRAGYAERCKSGSGGGLEKPPLLARARHALERVVVDTSLLKHLVELPRKIVAGKLFPIFGYELATLRHGDIDVDVLRTGD